MKKIAIMYDFDKTLSPANMQEFSLIPALGYTADEFWNMTGAYTKANNMDSILSALYMIVKKAEEKGVKLTREKMHELGEQITFYPGVEEYFDKINEYGRSKGLQVEHFIISSGNRELVEGCRIYPHFTKVFGSAYHFGKDGIADWPAVAINYTTKTQYLYRINKNALDITDNTTVNAHMSKEDRDIPFTRMIYIGDGFTDVPCMQVVKDNGGFSIAVYTEEDREVAKALVNDGRVNFAAEADYNSDTPLYKTICSILDKMEADCRLEEIRN
ncbi:MAG: haloacid dehalogenase-like hydrolase [Erysipelotrichaceae bacterium]|nr:haloacid dehalogenase-like hydrolase [Erysipelotrichaceae bacterium]